MFKAVCLSKLPDAATLPSCFQLEGWSSVSAKLSLDDKRRSAPELDGILLHIQPQSPANIVLLVLGSSPSHQVHLKHEEGLQLSYRLQGFRIHAILY